MTKAWGGKPAAFDALPISVSLSMGWGCSRADFRSDWKWPGKFLIKANFTGKE